MQLNEHEDSSRRFGDDAENETAAGIQHVTEQNKDGFEFRVRNKSNYRVLPEFSFRALL